MRRWFLLLTWTLTACASATPAASTPSAPIRPAPPVLGGFDPAKVARYDRRKIAALLLDPGIVRNRAKVEGTVASARAFLEVVREHGSFDRYVWSFVGGTPIRNRRQTLRDVPAETAESLALSKDLKKRGFTFVGPTICYAFMQATGLVNDHLTGCFRYRQV